MTQEMLVNYRETIGSHEVWWLILSFIVIQVWFWNTKARIHNRIGSNITARNEIIAAFHPDRKVIEDFFVSKSLEWIAKPRRTSANDVRAGYGADNCPDLTATMWKLTARSSVLRNAPLPGLLNKQLTTDKNRLK